MPKIKKTKTKTVKKEKTLEEIVASEVASQLSEALLNIEIEPSSNSDLDDLKDKIKEEVEFAYKTRDHQKETAKETQTTVSRSEIKLTADKEFILSSDLDGFLISEQGKPIFVASRTGAIGLGLKAPRGVGRGSLHIRANYLSEAPIPSNGVNSTRGLIVEGDGDDEKTYLLRAVSRMNRQGTNITSDGSLLVNEMNDSTLSKVHIHQADNDAPSVNVFSSSLYYDSDLMLLQAKARNSKHFNLINAITDVNENGIDGLEVFKVDGEGSVFAENSFYSNRSGYAELFEWADGNKRNENRNGYTVTLDAEGKLVIANEGDVPIGVVGSYAAVVGNTAWNDWHKKFQIGEDQQPRTIPFKIVEWVDDFGVLHSYDLKSLDKDFALPESAIIYETDALGDRILSKHLNSVYDTKQEYTPRVDRGWATVIMIGSALLWKGQTVNEKWSKIKDLNDDLEYWILR